MTKPIHVLALDDEENILSSIERNFLREPYRVFTTTRADKAWEILSAEKIKVIICDQRMPGLSGVQFLKTAKERYPDARRILLTGHADMQAAEEAVNLGEVYRFLTKPWNSDDLKITIREAIEAFDLTVENRRLFEETRVVNARLIQANIELQKLYDKQKEFTSTVSHELRTPLASIKMALDIVLSGTPGPLMPDQIDFLDRAKANVDRLNRLINDILDLSKLESGRISMQLRSGDLNQAILESLEPQRAVARNKGLRLECITDPSLPPVLFDHDRMLQVLYNLAGNAIKFTDTGFIRVVVKGDVENNQVAITVEDSGPGIKEEDLPRLFGRFQQLEGAVNHKAGGTGLGLAICKTIIELHKGKIKVQSKTGEGSRFECIIPIAENIKE
ncbi:MAG: hybrid sensor histidine kinase/response regulator [Candidatus Omnitrophica bacterium]|nr:hybrid sensor histidine kinase/response regulator [Candidatus Omnitrophota bacterium]